MSVEERMLFDSSTLVRIGSFSRSVGVTPETLRAWEDRYGLLSPRRSSGGYRLYSEQDARLVAGMKRWLQSGMPASEAARRAREEETAPGAAAGPAPSELTRLCDVLAQACLAFDAIGAHRSLDDVLARFSLDAVLRDCVIPLVGRLDADRARDEISAAQERFASRLLEGRLLAMASGWEVGAGPLALIARGPAERHIIGITGFGLALRNRGWRIVSLGQAVRPSVLAEAAAVLSPDVVVLSIGTTRPAARDRAVLRGLAERVPLAVGGKAATPRLLSELAAGSLSRDVVAAATEVAARHAAWRSARPVVAAAG
jgi:MerR family transcriptional regulator, light-induced transcriptional regulator